MVLDRIIEQADMECHMQERQLCLSSYFQLCPLISIVLLNFCLWRVTLQHFSKILVVHGSVIEKVNIECHMQELQLC